MLSELPLTSVLIVGPLDSLTPLLLPIHMALLDLSEPFGVTLLQAGFYLGWVTIVLGAARRIVAEPETRLARKCAVVALGCLLPVSPLMFDALLTNGGSWRLCLDVGGTLFFLFVPLTITGAVALHEQVTRGVTRMAPPLCALVFTVLLLSLVVDGLGH